MSSAGQYVRYISTGGSAMNCGAGRHSETSLCVLLFALLLYFFSDGADAAQCLGEAVRGQGGPGV